VWVGDVGFGLGWTGGPFGELVASCGGDTGHVFDADEAVGHFDIGLVEEIDEEVVMRLRGDEGGCHSKVLIVVFYVSSVLSMDVFCDTD
jgi:hypothetical protein